MGNQAGKYKVPKIDESGNASAKAQIVEPQLITSNGEGGATNQEPQILQEETLKGNDECPKEEENNEEVKKENGIVELETEEKPANGSASKDVVQNGNSNGHAHKDENEAETNTTHSKKKSKLNWITKKISFRKTKAGKTCKKGEKSQDDKIVEDTNENDECNPEETDQKAKEDMEQEAATETETTANGDVSTKENVPDVKITEPSFESIPAQEALEESKDGTTSASESQENNTSENAN